MVYKDLAIDSLHHAMLQAKFFIFGVQVMDLLVVDHPRTGLQVHNLQPAMAQHHSIIPTATALHRNSNTPAAPCSLNTLIAAPHHSITIPMGQAGHQCPLDSMGHLCISRDEWPQEL
jgi:hypothetical protein